MYDRFSLKDKVAIVTGGAGFLAKIHIRALLEKEAKVILIDKNLKSLKKRYNCKAGYSGHEPSVSPSLVACSLGATSLERHVTLDRASYGSDQSASLEETGLSALVGSVRKIKSILGNGEKTFLEEEKKVAKKLRYWE